MWSAHSGWTTLGLPQSKVACASWVYTAQAPECSATVLSQVGHTFPALPRSEPLRFPGILQGHKCEWTVQFVPLPGPSSSDGQVIGNCTVKGGPDILFTCPVPAAWFPRCSVSTHSQVCHVSPLWSSSPAVTLLADVNHPGSQEDEVRYWEPAHSLVEDAVSGAETVEAP